MKILFVYSDNKENGNTLASNQADSISAFQSNIEIVHFKIKGKGIIGYLKNLPSFISTIKKTKPNVIHAHYSLSGIFATLSLTKIPIVVSLMGSDVNTNSLWKYIVLFFSNFWSVTILKSKDMQSKCLVKNTKIIPNGVDLKKFSSVDKQYARKKLDLDLNKKYILFLADPNRSEKNFQLAKEAFDLIKNDAIELLVVHGIPHEMVVLYFFAVDIVLLTSIYEGSPNVIKEAMACNNKIVATNVGDVQQLIQNIRGCYITDFNPSKISDSLTNALNDDNATDCRERLIELALDSESVARSIVQVYRSILRN